jgi:hypothetical protein
MGEPSARTPYTVATRWACVLRFLRAQMAKTLVLTAGCGAVVGMRAGVYC